MAASGHGTGVRSGKVNSRTADMYAVRKSDDNIVPKKQANKEGLSSAESVEGRTSTKRNTGQMPTVRTQGREAVSRRLAGVRQAAKQRKEERFTALLHHVNVELLTESYYKLKRKAAAGVDDVTWEEYGKSLAQRLVDLHERIHSGKYRAFRSERGYIPKPDGGQRPLGIAALEDKIVQRALLEVLNQIYEVDFLGFTHICAKSRKGNYIVLRKTIRKRFAAKCQRIRSQVMQRMHDPIPEVGRWLRHDITSIK